ncbi:type 1 glutamine amidotransferase [Georgenia sp. H159]|uniref:type 1 glutamine amidotransferase n=1 Tax=Georgenia sp. H159 TaxID=3076115 RepID=UPI002D777405|nr:type 1 glutamine amidotransferase [Georgenia sp. H159]
MPSTRPRVTVVQNFAGAPLNRFAGWLSDVEVRTVRAFAGEVLPAAAGEGLLVLGGRMNAYADDVAPWLPATRRLIADSVAADVPVLGICLGHQLLAVATGGEVTVGTPEDREAGLVDVTWNPAAAADPVLGGVAGGSTSSYQYAMHTDGVTRLPPDAVHLAGSARYPVQALRVGSAVGVQFHPEASPAVVERWAEGNGSRGMPSVEAAVRAEHDDDVARVGRTIAGNFAAAVRDAA